MERQAFNELEQVMISASMPKKDRIQIIHEIGEGGSIDSRSKAGENAAASPSHYKSEASIVEIKGRSSRVSNQTHQQ
jgi:hypothetical protein